MISKKEPQTLRGQARKLATGDGRKTTPFMSLVFGNNPLQKKREKY